LVLCVGDVVRQPNLRLEILAGRDGMDRPVTWAHASDLPDPWNWLAGSELLMKNGRSLPRSASGQVRFFERLHAAEISALVIGADPETPPIHQRALRLADELPLPLLELPYSVSFVVLSRVVADSLAETRARRAARVERIYATIQTALRRQGMESFLRRLEEELGHRVHVLDAETIEPVMLGPQERRLDARLVAEAQSAIAARGGQLPAVFRLPDLGRRSAVIVEVPSGEPVIFLAEGRRGFPFDVSMLHHAAAAVAMALTYYSLEADFDRRALGALLLRAIDGLATPTEMADAGIDLQTSCLLLIRHEDASLGPERARTLLRRRQMVHAFAVRGAETWALVPVGSEQAVLAAMAGGCSAGLSGVVGALPRMSEAAREAAWAAARAHRQGGGLLRYGSSSSLPALDDPEAARALVGQVLGPLLEYDQEHGTDLVASLDAFLRCRRSWSRSAADLHVHRQTVVYRMRRVAQLTGRNLAETSDLAELWLALSARELLREANAAHGSIARSHAGSSTLSRVATD